jgi:hypothetical protein
MATSSDLATEINILNGLTRVLGEYKTVYAIRMF